MGESKQEGFGSQAAQGALYMEEVGGATPDVGAMIRYVGQQLAAIRRAAQGLLVGIKDGDIAAVAGQRVKHAGTNRGRHSV